MNKLERFMGRLTTTLTLREGIRSETEYLFNDSGKSGEELHTQSYYFDPDKALRTYQESHWKEPIIEIAGSKTIHSLGNPSRPLAKPGPLNPRRIV
jgi:hypothetical protein